MNESPSIGFVACIEAGKLEGQAILLFQSLRYFGGRLAGAQAYALSPRAGHTISTGARSLLKQLDVEYIDRDLNTECAHYGSANRVAAAAYIEATTRHDILVILDSDTVFVREPSHFLLASDDDAAVRPVDVKGICTSGAGDPNDEYWRRLTMCCGVSYDDIPEIVTTVDQTSVKANYNGGLVVARTRRGMMQKWAEFFFRSIREGIIPRQSASEFRSGAGLVPQETARLWGSNQAALSLALWSSTRRVRELPPGYNYPLHLHDEMPLDTRTAAMAALVHIHYHWLFDREDVGKNPLLRGEFPLPLDVVSWLRERVPLPTEKRGRLSEVLRDIYERCSGLKHFVRETYRHRFASKSKSTIL